MLDQLIMAWAARHRERIAAWRAGGREYVGRFAPSPTGPLHAGSLAAALASFLDARAHGGKWLLRMEDLDGPRTVAGAAADIIATLRAFGLIWDGDILYQGARESAYQSAFGRLDSQGLTFACACTRREIADSHSGPGEQIRGQELVYPGTCRGGIAPGRAARAWRIRVPDEDICFVDALAGPQTQNLSREVGDFVLKRADGPWAYQLAVVVDDGAQGVTHVVRGVDLIGSTARQIWLCRQLCMPAPLYLHLPVVAGPDGEKLSKQSHARALDPVGRNAELAAAWRHVAQPA